MKKLFWLFLTLLIPTLAFAGDATNVYINPYLPGWENTGSGGQTNFTIDGATDKMEVVFQCEKATTITQLCFLYGARTGTPVAQQVDLEGVNTTTGRADGTIKSSTNAKAAFTPPADATWDSTFQCKTLTSSYACTQGEQLAMVILPTGTPDGSNKSSYAYVMGFTAFGWSTPHATTVDAGTATFQNGPAPFAYKDSTRTYGYPIQSIGQAGYSSNTEDGNSFTIPSNFCSTFKVKGLIVSGVAQNTGKDVRFDIYSGTTSQQSITIDGDTIVGNGGSRYFQVFFSGTLATLNCGSTYRASAGPTGASSGWSLGYTDFALAEEQSALPLGTNMFFTTRAGGAWTDTTTRRASIGLILEDITAPSGSAVSSSSQNGGFQ